MARLSLNKSENVRDYLIREEEEKIRAMYAQLAEQTREQAKALEDMENVSSIMRKQYLEDLAEQLKTAHDNITQKLETDIPQIMEQVSEAVVDDVKSFLSDVKMEIVGTMSHVPEHSISAIINGQIYGVLPDGSNWTLSGSIWTNASEFHNDISMIVANGLAANKSTLEIARDLEKYVDPLAKKPWDWGKVYPGSAQQIDYNAQRLARTLAAHAYQYTLVYTTRKNPFVTGYIWHSVMQERTCEICAERDNQFYEKDALPLDHPNGLCYWECAIPDSMDEIADRLADWVNGKADPALDEYSEFLFAS